MMIVILDDFDAENALRALIEKDFRVTRVASTGGFLRRGNTTLLMGTKADRVDEAIEIIRATCTEPKEEGHSRATVFVLDMARFEQL
ncbi:MAG: hypothetical protein GTO14_09380 [Anaerolineales bacterium]|nr:hypothetical protein [Anaerolineales bacterium]